MDATLGGFLRRLDRSGELHRVKARVSPVLEIVEISQRQRLAPAPAASVRAMAFDPGRAEIGGRALLFEDVAGCDLPLCINVYGSYRRMEMALGCDDGGFETIARRIERLVRPEPPSGLGDLLRATREFAPLLRVPPRRRRRGRCQEIVKLTERGQVDLRRLPLIQCWPLDGDLASVGWDLSDAEAGRALGGPSPETPGRYITFAGMHTIHADDAGAKRPASHNIGMYRAQLLDATHLIMHWHLHHDGAAHWRSWKKRGRPMPIAICFGGESVLPYAATSPLPPGMSELLMAGFLNGRGIPLVRARTVPLWVPANSEVVIEGYVDTTCGSVGWTPCRDGDGRLVETIGPGAVAEGPFGDHTGYYSLPDRYPLVEVTAVTHRRDAVFPATIVGPPPQEDYYLGKATERIFAPLLRILIPDLLDYHLPRFGCFHNCAFVQIRKTYAYQARRVMHAVWGAGQMAWTKLVVVVDESIDVHDESGVLSALVQRVDPRHHIERTLGPLDILDHAAFGLAMGGKLGFDVTKPCGDEPAASEQTPTTTTRQQERLKPLIGTARITTLDTPLRDTSRLIVVGVDKRQAGEGRGAIEAVFRMVGSSCFVVAVDASVEIRDWERVFFTLCANLDPARDLLLNDTQIGFDATAKFAGDATADRSVRAWPPPLEMSQEIVERVDRRWGDYGFSK